MSYFGEEARSSPEIVKAHQPSITGDGIEIPLGAVVAGDARGHDQPCPATWADQIQKQFGEQGIGVQITHRCESKPATATDELAAALGFPLGQLKLLHQALIHLRGLWRSQGLDQPLPRGLVRRRGNGL